MKSKVKIIEMNCMSVQQEKKSYQRSQAYQQNSNTTSRVGLRSCLRGEIEDTECKIELFSFKALIGSYLIEKTAGAMEMEPMRAWVG